MDVESSPPREIWRFLESFGLKTSFRSSCYDWLYNGRSLAVMSHSSPEFPEVYPSRAFGLNSYESLRLSFLEREDAFHLNNQKNKIYGNFHGYIGTSQLIHELGHFFVASEEQRKSPEWGLFIGISAYPETNGGLTLAEQEKMIDGYLDIPWEEQNRQEDLAIWISWKIHKKLNLFWDPSANWNPFGDNSITPDRPSRYFSREEEAKSVMRGFGL